jgi:hypothetical protein
MFGKRSATPKTPEEMAAERERRIQVLQAIGATLSDVGAGLGGGQGSQVAALMARRQQQQQDDAQREQFGSALSDLMSQMRGPDTMTPQVNELIGGANMRGGQVGMAPMQMQTPRRAGLDYSDPATRDAFQRFIMAGGKPEFAQGIAESMQPPRMQTFNTRSGVVGVNPETGEVQELYQDPYAEALAQRQAEALEAQAYQRRASGQAAITRANRPPPPRPAPTAAIGGTFGGNTRTINGKTYYRVNGAWYDNPEGR